MFFKNFETIKLNHQKVQYRVSIPWYFFKIVTVPTVFFQASSGNDTAVLLERTVPTSVERTG